MAKSRRSYATVTDEEGVNYRDIAETLTEMGYTMNHSSVRNHVIRIMKKFADTLSNEWDMSLTEAQIDEIARSATFQRGIADALHVVETMRREEAAEQATVPDIYRHAL